MATLGDTIEHPVTGERVIFLKTAQDTDGELSQMHYSIKPRGFVSAEHVHPRQEERLEVLSGSPRFCLRGEERDLSSGDTVMVPAGTPHVWWNAGEEETHVLLEVRPALKTETLLESLFGLAQDGKVNPKSGLPNLLRMAVMLRGFEEEVYLARPPLLVQRMLFGALAPVARLLGYRAEYAYPYDSPAQEQLARADDRSSAACEATGVRVAALVLSILFALLLLWRRSHSDRR